MSSKKTGRGLIVVAVLALLSGPAAGVEKLDQGKPASKLFAETCVSCHRSARGLAKGRFSLTLYVFLQKHYTSDASSAWALASYLNTVDSEKRGKSSIAAKPAAATTGTARSSLRPPAAVPAR